MQNKRIPTGIQGLDEILGGGLKPASSYLIVGGPGTGKTILSFQFLCANVKHQARCLYITFSEPSAAIQRNLATFGWDLTKIAILDFTKIIGEQIPEGEYSIFRPDEVEREPLWAHIYSAIAEHRPELLVLDSVTFLSYLSTDEYQFRKQIQKLINHLAELGCVSLFLYEPMELEKENALALAVDGVINLDNTISSNRMIENRTITVLKQRGSAFLSGSHPFRITSEGIVIWPHWIEKFSSGEYSRSLLSSGNAQLDELLGGGIYLGGCTLIVGPSGVGKTTLAMQFLTTAAKQGQKGVYYTFEEEPISIQKRCRATSNSIDEYLQDGTLTIVAINPLLQYPDEFLAQIRNDIEHQQIKMLVLDGQRGYELAMAEYGNLTAHLQNMVSFVRRNQANLFIITEQEKLTGELRVTDVGVSYLADNIVMMRYAEYNGEIIKVVNCLKQRLGDFQSELRELKITANGILVGGKLSSLRGVLTGIPIAEATEVKPLL